MSPKVKICGLCRPEDAAAAAASGADYVGVVLAPGRKRTRSWAEAGRIYEAAGARARRVGVFVDAAVEELLAAAETLGLTTLQLHGSEPPEVVEGARARGRWEVWKAIRPRSAGEFLAGLDAYGASADGLLLDGWSAAHAGGSGARFPWEAIAAVRGRIPAGLRLIAAGGLTPENVARVVELLEPDVVDVSSGVELRPGAKDAALIARFVAAARASAGVAPGGTAV